MRACKQCGETKPESEFYHNSARPDGLSFYCKPCTKTRNAAQAMKPPKRQAAPGMKRCCRCKTEKPLDQFWKASNTYDGLDRRCQDCAYNLSNAWRLKNLEKVAADQRRWREENPGRVQESFRKRRYDVAHGWYAQTLAAQNGRCAICKSADAGNLGTFHVDHCHKTGAVRGLLCGNCNHLLGKAQDNLEILEAAKQYLLAHRGGGS